MRGKLDTEALEVRRRAERLLNELPPRDPDYEMMRMLVRRLRYSRVAGSAAAPGGGGRSQSTLENARAIMRSITEKFAQD